MRISQLTRFWPIRYKREAGFIAILGLWIRYNEIPTLILGTGLGNNDTTTAVPSKLVELTYSTNLDPIDAKTGYFIRLPPDKQLIDLGMITGCLL